MFWLILVTSFSIATILSFSVIFMGMISILGYNNFWNYLISAIVSGTIICFFLESRKLYQYLGLGNFWKKLAYWIAGLLLTIVNIFIALSGITYFFNIKNDKFDFYQILTHWREYSFDKIIIIFFIIILAVISPIVVSKCITIKPLFPTYQFLFLMSLFSSVLVYHNIPSYSSMENIPNMESTNYQFPLNSCGDFTAGGANVWYPIWVEYSYINLQNIRRKFCCDAWHDPEVNKIQVASFYQVSKAKSFVIFLQKNGFHNAEIGHGRWIYTYPSLKINYCE
ncbi:hypothetical protein [Limnospira fusiformis]|uniref:Uncharacterized protein n=2 Tax=Limnospira TaxID=2596745 RepID=A0A9P1KBI4_9CYAN|nr:conserved membrane protein of unknown function [Limnospira indica PCC 8005]